MARALSSGVSTRPVTRVRPKARRRRFSQSACRKKPSPPDASTSATQACAHDRVLVEAQLLGRARGGAQERRAQRDLLAHQVPLAFADERLVEGVVPAPGPGRDEADQLRPRVHAGVAQGVALEVEQARPREGLDLLPGHEGALPLLAAQEPGCVRASWHDVRPGRLQRAGARLDAAGHQEHDGLHAVPAQQGRGHAPDRAAAVVEGEHDGALRRLALPAQDGDVLVGRQRDVAVLGEVRRACARRTPARRRGTRRRARRRGAGRRR